MKPETVKYMKALRLHQYIRREVYAYDYVYGVRGNKSLYRDAMLKKSGSSPNDLVPTIM